MSRRWLAPLLGLASATLALPCAQAAGDLSGMWAIRTPLVALTTLDGQPPPLTPTARAAYRMHRAAAAKGDHSWDPVYNCKPPGEPRTLIEQGWPFEIMQSAHRVDFLFQWNRLDRSIPLLDSQPTFQGPYYFGQGIGHWDGDTLVVDVIGEKQNTFLDPSGLPHSDELKLTERFRTLEGGQTLEARLHVNDPMTYTREWDSLLTFRRVPAGTHIAEDVCIERLKLRDYASLQNSIDKSP